MPRYYVGGGLSKYIWADDIKTAQAWALLQDIDWGYVVKSHNQAADAHYIADLRANPSEPLPKEVTVGQLFLDEINEGALTFPPGWRDEPKDVPDQPLPKEVTYARKTSWKND